ncbi:secreted phosphoprotein 24-like isoform X2 [Rhincodon typus]|nr:secreted phosphoprotein 24-like isoform X2 [Rhincodon typus]
MTDFTPIVQDALKESILQLNRHTVNDYLLKATSNELHYFTSTEPNEIVVDLRFTARETLCLKTGGFVSENCDLNNDPFAQMTTCQSSVSYSFRAVVDVYLHCTDSSSESASIESVEEMRHLRRQPKLQDEHYSSVDWGYQNSRQFPQRHENDAAPRRPNKQGKPLSQGLSSRKKPNRKQNQDSKVE